MSAATGPRVRRAALDIVPQRWVEIHRRAPQVALTMLAYLEQMRVSARPATVKALETDLRTFALFVVGHDPDLRCVAGIGRSHVEAFKFWQRAQPGIKKAEMANATFRRRVGSIRMFFIRIIEWGWTDAPQRVPLHFGDVPKTG